MDRNTTAKSIDQAVREYVSTWSSARIPLSTRNAAQAVRTACPDAEHTDAELAEIVATFAIRSGCAVHFNMHEVGSTGTLPE